MYAIRSYYADLFMPESKGKSDEIKKLETEQDRLYAEIGRLTTQLNWLKKKGFDLD